MNEPRGHTTKLQSMLHRLGEGSPEAQYEIVTHACDRLRKLTQRMMGKFSKVRRWEQTDDVLQNAMMRLHRSLKELRPESPEKFYGLAATQIRRELIDIARKHFGPEGIGKSHQTDGSDDSREGRVQQVPTHASEPDNMEGWVRFHESVNRLPDPERQVFDLIWYEELTQPQVAELMSVSLKTVKRRWQSARILLRETLQGDFTG